MAATVSIPALVAQLKEASYAYHNGLDQLMTDAEFDAGVELLKTLDPRNPFLKQVGAPIPAALKAQKVTLPIPLPSLNKPKTGEELARWLAANPASDYYVSAKLDGCSALWYPSLGKLYTRGDGVIGRDISACAPYIPGLIDGGGGEEIVSVHAVRGELVIAKDSHVIPEGLLGRNIVAGFLATPRPNPADLKHIRFVAYQHLHKGSEAPSVEMEILEEAGFEIADSTRVSRKEMIPENLTEILESMDADCKYSIDGIVVVPDIPSTSGFKPAMKSGAVVNPKDAIAWKVRLSAVTARTVVRSVEWNVSRLGYLVPVVIFDPVSLSGSVIARATGLHGRWIYENNVGPGAEIEILRAGDVIPKIVAVLSPAPDGPAMPALYKWVGEDGGSVRSADSSASNPSPSASSVHIKPVGSEFAAAFEQRKLVHALKELGAENVGPGVVTKLYAGGIRDLKSIYAASPADFAELDGIKDRGAQRIWEGLRVAQSGWTELNFLVASSLMPRGVGHTKLAPLLELQPNPAHWPASAAAFKEARPPGISAITIDAIVAAIPAYLEWRGSTGLRVAAVGPVVVAAAAAVPEGERMTVVFTGVRDKSMEAALVAAGHVVGASVTKKTTHVVHADDADTDTGKIKKARETGATILSLSEMRALLGL